MLHVARRRDLIERAVVSTQSADGIKVTVNVGENDDFVVLTRHVRLDDEVSAQHSLLEYWRAFQGGINNRSTSSLLQSSQLIIQNE